MRALQIGCKGKDVKHWQYFLCGQGFYEILADGYFGRLTDLATKKFQSENELLPDGLVGTFTLSKAGSLGYELVHNPENENPEGIHWPPYSKLKPFTQSQLRNYFGPFSFQLIPGPNPLRKFVITDNWIDENLVSINGPVLAPLSGTSGEIKVHKKVAHQFERLFGQWKSQGLCDTILSFDGSFSARMCRGYKNQISSHSFGIAFDINSSWNTLGTIPPKEGKPGSVRKLAEIAIKNGFLWGGHLPGYKGMHFEVAELL